MDIIDFDILNQLFDKPYVSQRELSNQTGYSLGKVNQSLATLREEKFLDECNSITNKSFSFAEANKPENAIILAAGAGMRTYPLNKIISKGLLCINGEILVERLIRQLNEVGITDITIVVGFMKESYDYLIDKYGVELIVNTLYEKKNNLHSLNLVSDRIHNTYILPCDIWCRNNPFSSRELFPWFMVTDFMDDESYVRVNRKQELVEIDAEEPGNKMIGIAYLTGSPAEELSIKLDEMDRKKKFSGTFWEGALFDKNKMSVWAKTVHHEDIIEINSYNQIKELENSPYILSAEIKEYIASVFNTETTSIKDIFLLKNGTTNRTMHFSIANDEYTIRIPSEDNLPYIDRISEKKVYDAIAGMGISDEVIVLDVDKNYKISRYIRNSHSSNPNDWEEVKKCISFLKNVHSKNIKIDYTIDLFKAAELFEGLRLGKSLYIDYEETKRNVYKLKPILEQKTDDYVLCHGEACSGNFQITDDRIYLIDWENAGMQDPALDIAMTAIYSMYSKEDTDKLIDFYYDNKATEEQYRKVYAFMAVGGLMWSNWCEYKTEQGIEFGEYAMKQYRYAKDFYRYAIS